MAEPGAQETSGGEAPPPTGAAGGESGATGFGADLDQAGRDLIAVKGWAGLPDLVQSYVGLEGKVGAKGVIPPGAEATPEERSAWEGWETLGRPAEASADTNKMPEGQKPSEADTSFHGSMAPALHKAGLAQWQVDILADGLNAHTAEVMAGLEDGKATALATAETELKAELGSAYDAKLAIANAAIRQFGGAELAKVLEENGHGRDPRMVRAFIAIGETLAGDGKLDGGGDGETFAMTPADAQKEHARLTAEAAAAMDKNEPHPGWDKNHPEYREWQDKKARIAAMAWPGNVE